MIPNEVTTVTLGTTNCNTLTLDYVWTLKTNFWHAISSDWQKIQIITLSCPDARQGENFDACLFCVTEKVFVAFIGNESIFLSVKMAPTDR